MNARNSSEPGHHDAREANPIPATRQLTITLPTDAIEILESRVSSGRYANQSEAIEAAIVESILPPHDEGGLQHWIATEGVRRYDEMRADPSRRLTSDEVFEYLESERDEFSKAG